MDKNGEWQSKTEWHNVVAWKKNADKCKNLVQGERVLVKGKLQTREWLNDKEEKKYTLKY